MRTINFPPTLLLMKTRIFDALGFEIKNWVTAPESRNYDGCNFDMNGFKIVFRSAKITPTKTGQFVTFWKRNEKGETRPFELSDDFDFLVIYVQSAMHSGQFILSKTALQQHGIISDRIKTGKRGFRVYPPWDQTTNSQAQKTQKWQTDYFFDTSETPIDLEKIRQLFGW